MIVVVGVLAYLMATRFTTILQMAFTAYTMVGRRPHAGAARRVPVEARHRRGRHGLDRRGHAGHDRRSPGSRTRSPPGSAGAGAVPVDVTEYMIYPAVLASIACLVVVSLLTAAVARSALEARSSVSDPRELATELAEGAPRASGADAADVLVSEGTDFSVTVRKGEVETLTEAGSKALGLRVFVGRRTASTYSSDFSWPTLAPARRRSRRRWRAPPSEDAAAGLPDEMVPPEDVELGMFDPSPQALPAAERIERARRAEAAALADSPGITNSQGASWGSGEGSLVLRELARLPRRLSHLVGLALGGAAGRARRPDGARPLVHGRARALRPRDARAGRPHRGRAHAAPAGGPPGARPPRCRWCSIPTVPARSWARSSPRSRATPSSATRRS